MLKPVSLKEVERKAWRSFHQDGLWDVLFGLMLLTIYAGGTLEQPVLVVETEFKAGRAIRVDAGGCGQQALFGHQIGAGTGRDIATFGGAAAGAAPRVPRSSCTRGSRHRRRQASLFALS